MSLDQGFMSEHYPPEPGFLPDPTHTSQPADADIVWLTAGEGTSPARADMTKRGRGGTPGADWPTPDQDPSVWLARGAATLERTDASLARALRAEATSNRPVIVVRGLPVDAAQPRTPYDGVVDPTRSRQAVANLHAVLGCLGLHPIAYAGESASTLHAVCPTIGARGEVSSHGYDAALPFHTDYADRPIDEPVSDRSPAAAALAFAVERPDPAVPMQCVPTRRLLSALSPEQIRTGRSETFATRAPAIFGHGHAVRVRRLFLSDTGAGFRCRLNLGRMTGLTKRAARLLIEIRDILSDPSMVEHIHVRRGDIVVMDNQRVIHRRAAFTPRWDGTDRYFIRISATRDPYAGRPADPCRPWVWS